MDLVSDVAEVGASGLFHCLLSLRASFGENDIDANLWDSSEYRPVPSVIEAATTIFAGHDVRQIANADADNLRAASQRLLQLIKQARALRKRYLLMLTGVPGSGKTLAGLDLVHTAITKGVEEEGDIVYLSGNTPLVVVLRKALARDEYSRETRQGRRPRLHDVRLKVRTRIQHIIDFLRDGLQPTSQKPPHEHVIVFDEAQRAWNAKHGSISSKEKRPSLTCYWS
jgi:hypothetical protein